MMNELTAKIFQELQLHGKITRDKSIWDDYKNNHDVRQEIDTICQIYHYDLVESLDAIYMIPTIEATVGIKSNIDIKNAAGNQSMTSDILNIVQFLVIFILMEFFSGEDLREPVVDFFEKNEILDRFTDFCQAAEKDYQEKQKNRDESEIVDDKYNAAFLDICMRWGAKPQKDMGKQADKASNSKASSNKEGILNQAIHLMIKEGLIIENTTAGTIKPTKKCVDLMPYLLSKQRLSSISAWERNI